jgi:N-acyl-D-aspartate/D-glutamate deacylase
MDYDLKISGGTIFDGTGTPGVRGDVAIKSGKIAALGKVDGDAARTIDAAGLSVTPGFVDIHTHYDAQILWDRMLTISPWHGVTSVVFGNCGFGVAPTHPEHRGLIMRTLEKVEGMSLAALEGGLGYDWPFETFPQYLDALEKRGAAINHGALVGHTPVRQYVMGEAASERVATEAEIARMRQIVREALDAGAIGFATSKAFTHIGYLGKPVPSRFADFNEIETLTSTLRETGRGVVEVTPGVGLMYDEFAQIVRGNGRPITFAMVTGAGGPAAYRKGMQRAHELIDQGLRLVPQVIGRPVVNEVCFKDPFVFENMDFFRPVSEALEIDGKIRVYSDPAFRRIFKEHIAAGRGPLGQPWNYNQTWITYCPTEPRLEGRTLEEVMRERGKDAVDLALDLAIASRLEARFLMSLFNNNEDEVAELLTDRQTVLGLSDAGAHMSQLCDACSYTHLLGHWVREKKLLALEEAVRMITSRPAEVFGLKDRGVLKVGAPADVTAFDAATVGASRLRRVNDLPRNADRLIADAIGIELVVVNGTPIRQHGKDVVDPDGPLPGRLLRGGVAA